LKNVVPTYPEFKPEMLASWAEMLASWAEMLASWA
jgi:hypothetical protein